MAMDFSYINLLYQELNQKQKNIQTYCKSIAEKSTEIYNAVYEANGFVKRKYEALQKGGNNASAKIPSNSDFALDAKEKPIDSEVTSTENLKDLEGSIVLSFKEINFLFQKLQKISQNLVIAEQEYQDSTNDLFTAWDQIIEEEINHQ